MICACVFAFLLSDSVGPPPTAAIAPPPRAAHPKRLLNRPIQYRGQVLAVDDQSITVRGSEFEWPFDDVGVRRFVAGPALAAGKQDREYDSIGDYPLTMVRVGDRVYIMIRHVHDEDLAASVRIERRPGGFVPPAP